MKLTIHLSFAGNCQTAFEFYQKCLGGELTTMLTWGDSPISQMVPTNWHSKICHASLNIGSADLVGADVPPDDYKGTHGFQILLDAESAEDAKRIFTALAVDATISIPLDRTFWAECYGALTDRFGIQWEIQFQG